MIWLLLALAPLLQRLDVPANDGWVTDLAGLLDDRQERELEALMESFEEGSGHEIALLTVPSLEGEPIERFALEVARAWGIGKEETNAGALLVVARDDRELRIEVGRGLEGNLTDSISGRIIRDVIVPYFRAGDFATGLKKGVLAMHAAAGGDYGPIQRSPGGRVGAQGASAVCSLLFTLFLVFVVLGGRRRGGGCGGWLPWVLLGHVLSSRGHGSGGDSTGGFGGFGGFGGSSAGGFGGGGFGGFGGGGGFSGGGASGGW